VATDHLGMDSTISPTPAWRTLLRPLTSARSYTALTHHLIGLPLGVAYFTWLVTGISLGLGLAITLIGIPLLTLVLASVRPLLAGERFMSNTLLGTRIPPAPLAPRGEGWFGRLKAYWTDSATWRGIVYLLARFPIGILTFTVAVATYGTALGLLAAPILAPLDPMELGIWEPDTVLEGLALVPLGATVLLASAWISEAMAAMSRALARWGAR
jgi:multidrug transporter EmrE-like cation transporter